MSEGKLKCNSDGETKSRSLIRLARADRFLHAHRTLQKQGHLEDGQETRHAARWEETKEQVIKSQHAVKKQKP